MTKTFPQVLQAGSSAGALLLCGGGEVCIGRETWRTFVVNENRINGMANHLSKEAGREK